MPRSIFESSEMLQEKRVLEYVALDDLQAAVGFLLASPPERSVRYYRDALCTLAMAFAVGGNAPLVGAAQAEEVELCGQETLSPREGNRDEINADAPASTTDHPSTQAQSSMARLLFSQAAKVLAANAASVGDSLLGVPLLCATGQVREAAELLLDAGMWRLALALAARRLEGLLREEVVESAARVAAAEEGRLWDAARLLVGAGMPHAARDLLDAAGCSGAAHDLGRAMGLP